MKRIFTLIISLVLVMVFMLTTLAGCNLIKTDSEKDMNQVVATIKIADDIDEEKIYKKDLLLSYINTYYVYEQSYGYSREEVFEMIVKNTIESKVLVQSAILYFAEKDNVIGPWTAEKFLSQDEITSATYAAYKSINDLIDSYADEHEHEEKVQDSIMGTVRPVPAGAVNDEEVSIEEMAAYVQEGIDVVERRAQFNLMVKALKSNSLLGDDFDGSNILTTDYYKNLYKSYCEEELIVNYEQELSKAIRDQASYDKVKQAYAEIYNAQKELMLNDFITTANSLAETTDPILYGKQANGYGRVYHILLKAGEEQTKALKEWTEKNADEKDQQVILANRKAIYDTIEVYDQRTTWILSGYDFDGQKFTGDYTFLDNKEDSLAYMGTVTDLTPDAKADEKEYSAKITDADKMSVKEFLAFMEEYLYGSTFDGSIDSKKVDYVSDPVTFEKKVQELIFAFSNDESEDALNSYKGYLITADNQKVGEESQLYEVEFFEGGKELLRGDYGDYGYVVKATTFGYHIMFLSERYGDTCDFATLESYLDKEFDLGDYENWQAYYDAMMAGWNEWEDTDNYLYILVDKLTSSSVTNVLNKNKTDLINKYVYGDGYVVRNDSVYQDLFE